MVLFHVCTLLHVVLQGYVCPGMLVLLAADPGVKVIQESDTGGQEQEADTLVLGRILTSTSTLTMTRMKLGRILTSTLAVVVVCAVVGRKLSPILITLLFSPLQLSGYSNIRPFANIKYVKFNFTSRPTDIFWRAIWKWFEIERIYSIQQLGAQFAVLNLAALEAITVLLFCEMEHSQNLGTQTVCIYKKTTLLRL